MDDYRLPGTTHISYIHLRVRDLDRTVTFYQERLGFRVIDQQPAAVSFSASGTVPPQIILTGHPGAQPRPPRTTGLYHTAIRLPDRRALARVLRQLIDFGWWLQGAADHLVSEALYLPDAENNGIELYADRPRDQWVWSGDQVEMSTEALDIDGLLALVDAAPWDGIDPRTVIGHMHLNVSDLERSEAFYCDLLGFDVTQRSYPGALFVSAGGYHHHIGLNVWNGHGAPPPPPDSTGLIGFGIALPDETSRRTLIERARSAGAAVDEAGEAAQVTDPDGIVIGLVVAPQATAGTESGPAAARAEEG
jgi:catechol 2,3-dioxygenase